MNIRNKNSIRIMIIITVILMICIIPNPSSATEMPKYTFDKFVDFEEELDDEDIKVLYNQYRPRTILAERDSGYNKYTNSNNYIKPVSASASSKAYFNLADYVDIRIKNQKSTTECWAFSTLSSMETNLLYKQNINMNFSERHMNYATSSSFYDADPSELKYERTADYGGLASIGLAYLTNGQGAVLESQMPFEDNTNKISKNDINITPSYYVSDFKSFPSVYKIYNDDGSITYEDGYENTYTFDEVLSIRNEIKEFLVQHGPIAAVTASSYLEGYSDQSNIAKSEAFCCRDSSYLRDHGITIVGWDDNYSRDNFSDLSKPTSDGAYIVLQSYGDLLGKNGYMYISYEDTLIESFLYGVENSKPYDEQLGIYQNDYYGANYTLGFTKFDTLYYSTNYRRDSSKQEYLSKVAINNPMKTKLEVWVNPNGSDVSNQNLVRVLNKTEIDAGYHTVDVSPVQLTGDSFTIIVKEFSDNKEVYFNAEIKLDDYLYAHVGSMEGQSLLSVDGEKWGTLDSYATNETSRQLLKTADVCIKAFTLPGEVEKDKPVTPQEPSKDDYVISGLYIKKVQADTKTKDFAEKLSKIITDDFEIYDKDTKVDKDSEEKIKTGMKVIVNRGEYSVVVRGDISGNGKISLLDLSKLLSHYVEIKGYELFGANKEAGDMNLDNKISLVDLSQLLVIYSGM